MSIYWLSQFFPLWMSIVQTVRYETRIYKINLLSLIFRKKGKRKPNVMNMQIMHDPARELSKRSSESIYVRVLLSVAEYFLSWRLLIKVSSVRPCKRLRQCCASLHSKIHEYLWSHDAGKAWHWEDYITQTTYILWIHDNVLVLSVHIICHDLSWCFPRNEKLLHGIFPILRFTCVLNDPSS